MSTNEKDLFDLYIKKINHERTRPQGKGGRRILDDQHIYEDFKPLIQRKIMNECLMKDIIYMESAILRNDIKSDSEYYYEDWMNHRGNYDDYLVLSSHEKGDYVDEFQPENLIFIKEYNERPDIKNFIQKLDNIIKKGDQEIFNDTIEYYKGELEKQLII